LVQDNQLSDKFKAFRDRYLEATQEVYRHADIERLDEEPSASAPDAAISQGTKRYDRKRDLAREAQSHGGILKTHILKLQEFAAAKNICIFIRPVNPFAKGLIEAGFGTKDMSIKAKSSNLPPLNGLIPYDQKFGKKGYDTARAAALTEKNRQAVSDKVATKVHAEISAERIKFLAEKTGRLEIHGTWFWETSGEGLMIGSDFETDTNPKGKQFHFWGVKEGKSVKIYEARKRGSKWVKGKPVEVMGNREGKADTADYDLAFVAPHLTDLGPEHMPSLKVATFKEALERKTIKGQTEQEFGVVVSNYVAKNSSAYEPVAEIDGFSADDMLSSIESIRERMVSFMRDTVPEEKFKEIMINDDDENDVKTEKKEYLDQLLVLFIEERKDELIRDGLLPGNTPSRSLGIVSNYLKNLLPSLNRGLNRGRGQDVFHHGADAENPFSEEKDNYPMTVVLPDNPDLAGDTIRVVKDSRELAKLMQHLKDLNYHVPINHRWDDNPDLVNVRRTAFTQAKKAMEKNLHFRTEPVDVNSDE